MTSALKMTTPSWCMMRSAGVSASDSPSGYPRVTPSAKQNTATPTMMRTAVPQGSSS